MTWAIKRQLFYIAVLIVFFGGTAYLLIHPQLNKEPTCSDRKQNGDELGVDCGGACTRACIAQVDDVSVLWSRAFRVVPGRYNVVAYLSNHNKNIAVNKINYRFRFADKNNIYIGKREGSTIIPPSGNFAIFESGVDTGNSIPVYVTFEFTEAPKWTYVEEEKIDQVKILVSNIELTGEDKSPKLTATVRNRSLFTVPNVDVVAILYDSSGNSISSSRTFLDVLGPEELAQVTFTWPEAFTKKVVRTEIIPMFNIFSARLQ